MQCRMSLEQMLDHKVIDETAADRKHVVRADSGECIKRSAKRDQSRESAAGDFQRAGEPPQIGDIGRLE